MNTNISSYTLICIVLTGLLLTVTTPCTSVLAETSSERMKVVTVDFTRIINELDEAKNKKKQLESMTREAEEKLKKEKNSLQAMEKKIEKGNLSRSSEQVEELRKAVREYKRAVGDAKEDLNREYIKATRNLSQKVLLAVERYAKKNQIDLVLDKSQNTPGPVLFGHPSNDITAAIIKEINS